MILHIIRLKKLLSHGEGNQPWSVRETDGRYDKGNSRFLPPNRRGEARICRRGPVFPHNNGKSWRDYLRAFVHPDFHFPNKPPGLRYFTSLN